MYFLVQGIIWVTQNGSSQTRHGDLHVQTTNFAFRPFIAKFSHELITVEDGNVVKSLSLFARLGIKLTATTTPACG